MERDGRAKAREGRPVLWRPGRERAARDWLDGRGAGGAHGGSQPVRLRVRLQPGYAPPNRVRPSTPGAVRRVWPVAAA
eukprot:4793117-Prymnesium_polylepis.2